MSDEVKKLKPIEIIPIREVAEPEEWMIQFQDGDYIQSKRVFTVKGRNTQEIDWKGYVEMKHGPFFGATKLEEATV